MRTGCSVLVLLCVSSILLTSPVWAAPTVSGGVDVFSKYLWRGFNLCDHAVWQPSITVTEEDWDLNLWASLDSGDNGRCTEFDYTLTHSFPLGAAEATAGFIYYTFPTLEAGGSSKEVFLGVTGPENVPISLNSCYDYDEGDGLYLELATEAPVSRAKDLGEVALALGYNAHQWREDTGFSHLAATYSRDVSAGRYTITPVLIYSVALADDFENELCLGMKSSVDF